MSHSSLVQSFWFGVWPGLKLRGSPLAALDEVYTRYAEPHRFYHTIGHIEYGLQKIVEMKPTLVCNVYALAYAFIMHDFVYSVDPEEYPLNEERSAAAAAQRLMDWEAELTVVEDVEAAILATRHRPNALDPLSRTLVDIDLASLGDSWQVFSTNAADIRREFAHVPDDVFYPKNLGFLQSLLARGSIYHTSFFLERCEKPARVNIKRHLTQPELQKYL